MDIDFLNYEAPLNYQNQFKGLSISTSDLNLNLIKNT